MKIKMLVGYSPQYKRIAAASIKNRESYCTKHGYELIVEELPPRATAEEYFINKYRAIEKHLNNCDWLFWSNVDSLILNQDIKLESFLDVNSDVEIIGPILVFKYRGTLSYMLGSTTIFFKNSDYPRKFLDDYPKLLDVQKKITTNYIDRWADSFIFRVAHSRKNEKKYWKLLATDKMFVTFNVENVYCDAARKYQINDFIVVMGFMMSRGYKTYLIENFINECYKQYGDYILPSDLNFERDKDFLIKTKLL